MATVRKRGKSYHIRVYLGYKITGIQNEYSMTWTPPPGMTARQAEKEAQIQGALFEAKVRSGLCCNGQMLMVDFAEVWFRNHAEPNLRPRTVQRYRELWDSRSVTELGHFSLEKLRPVHILEFYRKLGDNEPANARYCSRKDFRKLIKEKQFTQKSFASHCDLSMTTLTSAWKKKPILRLNAEKICAGLGLKLEDLFVPQSPEKKLSSSTVRRHHSLIHKMLADAVQWGYISYSPADRIAPPKNAKTEIEYLDDLQAKHLVTLLQAAPSCFRRLALLDLHTGLRRSELLGLEWNDIDWDNKRLRIVRTSQYLSHRGVFTDETKNQTSERYIYISDKVITILKEHRQWQLMQAAILRDVWVDSGRVGTNEDGTPMKPARLSNWFKKFMKKTDLPHITFHGLRHTYATICITKGIDISTVAAQLGHANPTTTLKIYSHVIQAKQQSAAQLIANVLDSIL